MKSLTRRFTALFVAFAALVAFALCFGALSAPSAKAETANGKSYFHGRLSYDQRAEKFYTAYQTLMDGGEFKDGKIEYDLIASGTAAEADVAAYVNGTDNKIIKAFGAGRDSFIMDNPDLFYVDLFGTSVSAGQIKDKNAAYLDSSRALTLYNGSINSEKKVDDAVAEYESKLNAIVDGANSAGGGEKEKVEFVNKYISEHTEYSFGTEVKNGKNVDTPAAAYINTAYGPIVNGKAICGGYAKAFKAVMDRLGIGCVCVQGYAKRSESANFEPHMWNYVNVEGMWYAVDVTYNDTSGKLDKILLTGGEELSKTHTEDNIISSSGFELSYPAIKPYDYGNNSDDNGMTITGEYKPTESAGTSLELTVSYEDSGAKKLREEGKYLVFSMGTTDTDKQIVWTQWYDFTVFGEVYAPLGKDNGDSITCMLHAGIEYIRFALLDYAPDDNLQAFYPNDPDRFGDKAGQPCYYSYKPENLTDEHFISAPSVPYHNSGYGTYKPAPGASGVYPSNSGALRVDQTYEMRIVYNVQLELDDLSKPAGIDFTTSRGNDTVKDKAVLTDFNWDGNKTITFTFTPSPMFIHNGAYYYFTPTNLVGADSKRVPDAVSYNFKGKSIVCSKVFNDGRLYMNVFGDPKMLDDSDLSVTDFKDENGNYYAASQRSQLMLVASKPSDEKQAEMMETLESDAQVKPDEIVSSASYEINLHICGVVRKVPNGSYMQVAFGFPEGFSPDDKGTTFKVYHYKHDDKGNITGVEEIPVVVTEYGLIARVNSFSPFTVVQVKNTSAAVTDSNVKTVYAYVNGNGGSVTTGGKSGIAVIDGDKITYNIKADKGFQVGYVRLNGKILDSKRYSGGKLVLDAGTVASSNMLEVYFVTEESAKSYAAKGISLFYDGEFAPEYVRSNTAGIVIGLVVAVLVLSAGAFAAWWFVFRKRQLATANVPSKKAATPQEVVKKVHDEVTASKVSSARPAVSQKSASAKPAASKQTSTAKPATAAKSTATAKPATKSASAKPAAKPTQTKKK